ncbi:MAG: hypothetical protein GY786_06570 [Proteobacteria bacterium]|nr:hypothetical protein [Pseudomonadota bacterium]
MAEDELEESKAIEEKGSSRRKQQIIILAGLGVVLLVLIAGGVTGYFYFFTTSNRDSQLLSQYEIEFNQIRQSEVVRLLEPKYVKSQLFTINLLGGKKYLKIKLTYALQDLYAVTFLEQKLPVLDDMVIAYIQNRTVENLRSRHGIELLKLNILKLANSVFTDGYLELSQTKDRLPVKQVLITSFFLN